MKKIYLFSKFLFITGILLFFSCEKDDSVLIDEELSNSNPFKIEKLTFQQASQNSALVEKLNNFSSNSGLNRRIVATHNNDVYIDTDIVTYIEDLNGNHSYIFSMYSNNSDYLLENLVLSNTIDNSYRASIIQYDITEDELEQLKTGNSNVLTSRNIILKPFDLNSLNGSLFRNGYNVCACGLHVYPGDDGLNYVVDHIYPDGTVTWIHHDCGGGGSSSGSNSGNTSGNTSGSNDGGWSGNGNTDGGTQSGDGNTNGTSGGTSGSSGSGTTSTLITTPVGIDGGVINDPCIKAIKENKKVKTIYNESNFQYRMNQINGSIPTDTFEKGFNFGTKPIDNSFATSEIQTGTATGLNLPVTNPNFDVQGSVHTHPGSDSFDSFSPADFYGFIEANTANTNFSTVFVLGATSEVFCLTITDSVKFQNFIGLFPKIDHFDPATNGWKVGSPIEKAFMDAFKKMYKQNGNVDEAYALANAYVLNKFNAGMSISKKNTNGDFETLFVEEVQDPADEEKTIYQQTTDCNLNNKK